MEFCDGKFSANQQVEAPESRIELAGKHFHFIGAGGIGMSGLAKVLLKNEAIVTGSDQHRSRVTDTLRRLGADIKIGHLTEHLNGQTDAVIYSAAIKENNPELQMAGKRGCRIYKYAQMLGRLMSSYDGIAISGTHGKSTTCGWLVWCLKQAGLEPNYIVGADITQLGGSSGVDEGDLFVAEACEYDRSFVNLRPRIAAILNIEQDHLDCYKDEQQIIDAFGEFAERLKPDGVLITNGEDSNTCKLTERLNGQIHRETFGLDSGCDFYAHNIRPESGFYQFDIYHQGRLVGPCGIQLPGVHNVMNALAAFAVAFHAGAEAEKILPHLSSFKGVDRRLTFKGEYGGVTVLDDYAHHPTEIKASLAAIRQRYEPERLWCIFQPHQYSRTRFLLNDFAESFSLSDVTIVPSIYFVRDSEASRQEVNSRVLVEKIKDRGAEAVFIDDFQRICDYLSENVNEGDLVVTMGAGDVWKVADEYIQRIRENS